MTYFEYLKAVKDMLLRFSHQIEKNNGKALDLPAYACSKKLKITKVKV